jgi:predicted extracellular nuclease
MTTTTHDPGGPTMDEEFQRQLTQLLRAAVANDIDVRGGWLCRTEGDGTADWDLEIVGVAADR